MKATKTLNERSLRQALGPAIGWMNAARVAMRTPTRVAATDRDGCKPHRQLLGALTLAALLGPALATAQTDPAIEFSKTLFELTDAGQDTSYTVVLNQRPSENVTLTPTTHLVEPAPRILTFTPENWNEPQSVYLNGRAGNTRPATVRYRAQGGQFTDVQSDTIRVYYERPRASLSTSGGTIREGERQYLNIEMDRPPSEEIQLTYRVRPLAEGGHDPAERRDFRPTGNFTVVFAPGQTRKRIHVYADEDANLEDDERFELELTGFNLREVQPGSVTRAIFTITDATSHVDIRFPQAKYIHIEGEPYIDIPITMNAIAEHERVTVNFYAFADTAEPGEDYTVLPTTVHFEPGQVRRTVRVAIRDDRTAEGTERFAVQLLTPPNSPETHRIVQGNGIIEIRDNEASVHIASDTTQEGKPLEFEVSLEDEAGVNVEVDFEATFSVGDTAESGDYTARAGTLTFAPGERRKTVEVQTHMDSDADDEQITFRITNRSNALIPTARVKGIIHDTHSLVDVSLAATTPRTIDEGGTLTLSLTPSAAPGSDVRVRLAVSGDNAGAVSFNPPVVTLPEGATGAVSATVTVTDDNTYRPNLSGESYAQRFSLSLGSFEGPGRSASGTKVTLNVRENDAIPTLALSGDSLSVNEGDAFAVRATLSRSHSKAVQIGYRTSHYGSKQARAGSDYVAVDASATFAPGETQTVLPVRTIEDKVFEANEETLRLAIRNTGTAEVRNGTLVRTLTIHDDERATIGIDERVRVDEDDRHALAYISSDLRLGTPIDIRVAVKPGAGTATRGTSLRPAAGEDFHFEDTNTRLDGRSRIHGTVARIWDDSVPEPDETFQLQLTLNGSDYGARVRIHPDTAQITIRDDEVRGVEITPTVLRPTSARTSYRVRLDTVPTGNVTITPTLILPEGMELGTDIARLDPASRTFTPESWNRYQTFTYTLGDEIHTARITHAVTGADYGSKGVEADDVTVEADAPSDDVPWVTFKLFRDDFTLIDDDSLKPYGADALWDRDRNDIGTPYAERTTVLEGVDHSVRLQFTLSRPAPHRITVPYQIQESTAVRPRDFTGSGGTIVFNRGETEKSVRARITNNGILERTEQFVIRIDKPPASQARLHDLNKTVEISPPGFLDWPLDEQDAYVKEVVSYIERQVVISDDDKMTVGVTAPEYFVDEGDANILIPVRAPNNVAVYQYRLLLLSTPGSALDNTQHGNEHRADFKRVSEVLTMESLQREVIVSIPIIDDKYVEEQETFSVSLLRRNAIDADIKVVPAQAVIHIRPDPEDQRGAHVSTPTIAMYEGETRTYEVILESWVQNEISVVPTVTGAVNTTVSPATASIPETRGNPEEMPRVVFTIHAPEDQDEEDEEITITHAFNASGKEAAYADIPIPKVTVNVYDNDGIGITPVPGSTTRSGITLDHARMDTTTVSLGRASAEGLWLTEGWSQQFTLRVPGGTETRYMLLVPGGTARIGTDYTLHANGQILTAPYNVEFAPGTREAVLTLTVLRDAQENERTETITLQGRYDGHPVLAEPLTIQVSPCGGSHPEALAWMSVQGEDPIRRHHLTFNPGDPIPGPEFTMRVCFRDAIAGLTLGEGLGANESESLDFGTLRQTAPKHVWTVPITAHEADSYTFVIRPRQIDDTNGHPLTTDPDSHITWRPQIASGRAPPPPPPPTPLTAILAEPPPATHDGETAFQLELIFSEELHRNLSIAAVQMEGGGIETISANDDRRQFSVTVRPSGRDDVRMQLLVPEDCTSSNAVCTTDLRPLERTLEVTITGPGYSPEHPEGEPLRVWFVDPPAEYFGEFNLRIAFSEPIAGDADDIALSLTVSRNVRRHSISSVNERKDLWEITIEPDPWQRYSDDIWVYIHTFQDDCSLEGALCTENGRLLRNHPTATIKAPAIVSIEDATANELVDSHISFAVHLSRPLVYPATVQWATLAGTATAGEDYVAQIDTLELPAGATGGEIAVELIRDSVDEDEEHFQVVLTQTNGVLEDWMTYYHGIFATGTITNDGAMPRAWIARFGRTIGSHAIESVSKRMDGEAPDDGIAIGALGLRSGTDGEAPLETLHLPDEERSENKLTISEDDNEITLEDIYRSTSFHWSSNETSPSETAWATWGHVLHDRFEGVDDNVAVEGDVTSAFVGADLTRGPWRGGLALSLSEGEGSFQFSPAAQEADIELESPGEVTSRMTSLFPYLGYRTRDERSLWGTVGIGTGTMSLVRHTRQGSVLHKTSLGMNMAGLGGRLPLLSTASGSLADIAFRSDAMWVHTTSEATRGMASARTDVTRVRAGIDASRKIAFPGSALTPSVALRVRHDAGDAERGLGVEGETAVRYRAGPLTLEGSVHGLLAHTDADYEEWGASAALGVKPSESGRGLTLRIAPAWGEQDSDPLRFWSENRIPGTDIDNERTGTGRRIDTLLGYGVAGHAAGVEGVITPYMGMSLGDRSRRLTVGTRWTLSPAVTLAIELERETQAASPETEDLNAIAVAARVSW